MAGGPAISAFGDAAILVELDLLPEDKQAAVQMLSDRGAFGLRRSVETVAEACRRHGKMFVLGGIGDVERHAERGPAAIGLPPARIRMAVQPRGDDHGLDVSLWVFFGRRHPTRGQLARAQAELQTARFP